jgi:diguanylate cyclase (GGDEF)-like protein
MLMRKSDNIYELISTDAFDLEKNICALADAIVGGKDQTNVLNIAQRVLGCAQNTNMCISEQKKKIEVLERDCITDILTKVLNRRGFETQLKRAMSHARRHNTQLALIYINLENIKEIASNQGPEASNAVLCKVANVLEDYIRDTDHVSRLGDDEFVILLNDASLIDAHSRTCTLHWALNHTSISWQDCNIAVQASLGTEGFSPTVQESTVMLHADKALCSMNNYKPESLQYA